MRICGPASSAGWGGDTGFPYPDTAANAFDLLARYHYNQHLSQQTLPPLPLGTLPEVEPARELVRQIQSERREASEQECRDLLRYFHVPVVDLRVTHDQEILIPMFRPWACVLRPMTSWALTPCLVEPITQIGFLRPIRRWSCHP